MVRNEQDSKRIKIAYNKRPRKVFWQDKTFQEQKNLQQGLAARNEKSNWVFSRHTKRIYKNYQYERKVKSVIFEAH